MASEQQQGSRTVIITGSSRGMYVFSRRLEALRDRLTA